MCHRSHSPAMSSSRRFFGRHSVMSPVGASNVIYRSDADSLSGCSWSGLQPPGSVISSSWLLLLTSEVSASSVMVKPLSVMVSGDQALAEGSCKTAAALVKYSGGLVANTIFTTTEKQTLRRFRSGGESAHRSLNVIGWRHLPSCWLWFKTTWFQTKTLAFIGLFQKSILYFIERVPRNPYLLTITVGLVTSRGLCDALFLGTSLFLRIDYVGRSPPYLLGLGYHADADAAGTHHLFRICFPHVIAFLFYFFSYT